MSAEKHCVELCAEIQRAPQRCPVCGGQGHNAKPPNVPGDIEQWSAFSTASSKCHACDGTGLVWAVG